MSKKLKKLEKDVGNKIKNISKIIFQQEKPLNDFLIADAEYRHRKALMNCSPDEILKLKSLK